MPLDVRSMFEVLQKLADAKGMKATVKEAAKSGFIAGTGAFAGALLGGPPGILIGGAMGSLVAYMTAGKFQPVSEILMTMDDKHKQLLYDQCQHIVAQLDWTDTAVVVQLLMADAILTDALMGSVSCYLQQQFNVQISSID